MEEDSGEFTAAEFKSIYGNMDISAEPIRKRFERFLAIYHELSAKEQDYGLKIYNAAVTSAISNAEMESLRKKYTELKVQGLKKGDAEFDQIRSELRDKGKRSEAILALNAIVFPSSIKGHYIFEKRETFLRVMIKNLLFQFFGWDQNYLSSTLLCRINILRLLI